MTADSGKAAAGQAEGLSSEVVLLLHGLCGHRLVMWPLAKRLRGAGYRTINWGYRSLTKDIESHAERLLETIQQVAGDSATSKIHIVAHSLGSIITRQALTAGYPSKVGRVVMIGPPNHGSHAATRAARIFGGLSKTLCQIADGADSWVNQMDGSLARRVQVGVIVAGGDLVVARPSTGLAGVQDTTEIPGMHSGILFKSETAQATLQFLRQGKFETHDH